MTANKSCLSRPGIVKCLFILIFFFIASSATSCSYALNTDLPTTLEKQLTVEWIYTPSATPTFTPTPTQTPTPTPIPTPLGGGTGRLAFSDESYLPGKGQIYLVNNDGTGLTQLTTSGYDFNPAWSPDGRKIIFLSQRNNHHSTNNEIYIMNADGSDQTRLSNSPAIYKNPAWSPDGKHIVFVSNLNRHREIYTMNSDGSGQTRLTVSVGSESFDPSWSPDGTQIVYSTSSSARNESQIYVMNSDGSKQTQLTNNPGWSYNPSWSPDGTRIAYTYANISSAGQNDIFVMNADGSGQTKLTGTSKTSSQESCQVPNWSPDSANISFICSSINNPSGTIHIMNITGSGQLNVDTKINADQNLGAVWQP